jgi:transposase
MLRLEVKLMARPKKYIINLSADEVAKLKTIIRNKKTSKTVVRRCQVLMDLDESHGTILTHAQASKSNAVSLATVTNIVKDYIDGGIDKAASIGRSQNSDNAKRKLDGRAEAKIITLACGPAPEGHSRWTLRLLEEKSRIVLDEPVSKDTIQRALKKTNFDLTATITGASPPKKTQNL